MFSFNRFVKLSYKRHYSYTSYLNDNLKVLSNEIKNKTDDIAEVTFDSTLSNVLKIVRTTENKIRIEKIDNVEINVSATIGPISVSISKKISLE